MFASFLARLLWAEKQAPAVEFSRLTMTEFRGQAVYCLPIDSAVASARLKDADERISEMLIFGRYDTFLTEDLNLIIPIPPQFRYQLRWIDQRSISHGK